MTSVAATKAGMSRGVAWMAVFKVAERLIALVSMTVLARLLVPADFGLVVLATSMIGVLEVLGAFGLDTALIREREATSGHFDAVWTFNALFALAVAIVVAALAPAVAWLYGEPRLTQVLLVLALARAIGGLESPGPLAFRKELAFDREVAFLLAKRLAMSALVTLPLAFVLRSYWALVAGTFAGTCLSVALSYVVHPYRPTFSLRELPALMHFSKWLFVANLLEVLHGRAADFVIGYSAGPSALGAYTAGREVARVASGEIAAPVNRAVFPGYVKLAADRAELRRACLRVTSVLALFIIPAAVGLCLLARPAVLLLLGEKWLAAVPIVQLLAVQGALAVLVSTGHYVNLAVGMSRSTTLVLAASAAISLPLILVLVPALGATGAAVAVLAASLVTAPLNLHLLAKAIPLRARDVGGLLWRPAVGSAAMAGVLGWLAGQLEWPASLPAQLGQVLVLIAAGAIAYAACVAIAWSIHHDAHSAEAWIVRTLGDRLQRSRRASVSTSD